MNSSWSSKTSQRRSRMSVEHSEAVEKHKEFLCVHWYPLQILCQDFLIFGMCNTLSTLGYMRMNTQFGQIAYVRIREQNMLY